MSNMGKWVMNQLDKFDMTEEKRKQYKSVLNAFIEQGHTGFTAGYALSYIKLYLKEGYEKVEKRLLGMLMKDDEDGMQSAITKDILQIIDMFKEYEFEEIEAYNLVRLMNWKPIIPLTGVDDEWNDSLSNKEDCQQNKLCSAVFRYNHDNSTAYYIDGKVFSDNGGHTWYTNRNSRVPVTFPFYVPDNPEYIYLNGEDSEEVITDEARIKELYNEWERKFEEEEKAREEEK